MERSYIEILKKALEARMKEGGLPPRLEIPEGSEAIVRVIDIMENPWREGSKVYIVMNLEDGLQYRLPVNVAIDRILKDFNVKVGDYLLLKYLGSRSLASGKTVKRWSVGYLSSEDAEKLLKGKESSPPKAEVKEQPKQEEQKTPSDLELKGFIDSLISIYGFTTIHDLDHYFNKIKKYGITVDENLITRLGFKMVGDKIVK
jgi:hypothetical protein